MTETSVPTKTISSRRAALATSWIGRRELRAPAVGIAVLLLLPLARDLWVAQLVLVPLVLMLPGLLLLRALRVPGTVVRGSPAYVPCASLVVLLASGLAADLVGPALGVAQPLRLWPLLVSLAICCLGLLAGSLAAGPDVVVTMSGSSWRLRPLMLVVLPVLAAAGAAELNNGHGPTLAIVAAVLTLLAVVALPIAAPRLGVGVLRAAVFVVGLSRAWSFSLRGQSVYGFDISTEYYDLQETVAHGLWLVTHTNDAYGAMLSTTVLPAELHEITGLSALMIFKALYPIILAVFPVLIFDLAAKFVEHRWAAVAALLVGVQSYFAQQVTAVARQEIALVLFAGLIVVLFDQKLGHAKWPLLMLLGLGVVVTHYSTTYLAITILLLAVFAQLVVSRIRRRRGVNGSLVVALITVMAGAALWYGAITHSTSNLSQFTQTVRAEGFSLLPNRTAGENPILAYLTGNSDQAGSATAYQQYIQHHYSVDLPYVVPLPNANQATNALLDDKTPGGTALTAILSDLALVVQQVVNLLAAIGAVGLALWRRQHAMARLIGLLSLGTLVVLVVTRLSGTVATVYNQERAILQAWLLLGVSLVWLLDRASQVRKLPTSAVISVTVAGLGVLLVASSGLLSAVVSGPAPTNLTNSGEDAERFEVTAPELAAALWLRDATTPGQLIYADRYAQLRVLEVTGRVQGLLNDITPQTLDQHAWVYADRANVVDSRARTSYDNQSISYQFPADYLGANYDLVYTNGSAQVYRR